MQEVTRQGLTCPCCEAFAPHQQHKSVHYWLCEACPFIAFEYWGRNDVRDFIDLLKTLSYRYHVKRD